MTKNINTELDMDIDTNDFIRVLFENYTKLTSITIRLFPFDKYVDLVLRQEELKRIDRHNMEYVLK